MRQRALKDWPRSAGPRSRSCSTVLSDLPTESQRAGARDVRQEVRPRLSGGLVLARRTPPLRDLGRRAQEDLRRRLGVAVGLPGGGERDDDAALAAGLGAPRAAPLLNSSRWSVRAKAGLGQVRGGLPGDPRVRGRDGRWPTLAGSRAAPAASSERRSESKRSGPGSATSGADIEEFRAVERRLVRERRRMARCPEGGTAQVPPASACHGGARSRRKRFSTSQAEAPPPRICASWRMGKVPQPPAQRVPSKLRSLREGRGSADQRALGEGQCLLARAWRSRGEAS